MPRLFEIVTEQEWRLATAKRNNHVDLHAALRYLRREPAGTKVKVPCPNELYMKKYYALNAAADKSGLRLKTKWKNGWLYVMKTERVKKAVTNG